MKYCVSFLVVVLLGCAAQTEGIFVEKHRPQFHFSPPAQWSNDPNGMVYYEGEYHLFYQHFPDSNVWGPMHWGHAVSEDLVHWQHLPIALYPDSLGLIFSGSAVVDWHNTSGFGKDGRPPIVAIFTYHNMEAEKAGIVEDETQGIAYSLDNGRTFTKYEGNPVIPNPGLADFRDPKVIWHSETRQWVMVLAAKDRIKFYTSPNLKDWQHASDFGMGQGAQGRPWECPDLFPMTVQETGEQKWVLIVSVQSDAPNGGTGTTYFVGDFDGRTFTNSETPEAISWMDYGRDNYAFVTWSDVPEDDGRRLGLGWMNNWQYAQILPTKTWRGAMTLPRELILTKKGQDYLLVSRPVEELRKIEMASEPVQFKDGEEIPLKTDLLRLDLKMPRPEDSGSFSLIFSNDLGENLSISVADTLLTVDRTQSGVVGFHRLLKERAHAPLVSAGDEIKLTIYLDRSSVEVFVNDGELVMTELFFPNSPYNSLTPEFSNAGSVTGSITPLQSIWSN